MSTKKNITLGLMPFWAPLVPPFGLKCLQDYLEKDGHKVEIFDCNIKGEFDNIYKDYIKTIKKWIPKQKLGNVYNVGNDVLNNHLMLELNRQGLDSNAFNNMVSLLIESNFYFKISDKLITDLNSIVKNFYIKLEDFIISIIDKKLDIFGLSVFRGTLPASMFAFKLVKSEFPEIKTVMGGPVFSQELIVDTPNFKKFVDETDYIDKIVIGEGEILFTKILNGNLKKDQRVYMSSDIDNERVNINLPLAQNYSVNDLGFYPYMPVYTSRSCPFQCSFCSETINWGKFRKRSIDVIVNDFEHIQKEYNTQLFLMADSLINPVLNDLTESLIKHPGVFYFDAYLRVDKYSCDYDKVFQWRKGGFYRARLGIESGSQKVLDLMDKKVSMDQVKSTIINLAKVGIKTSTYWIVGHPGEQESDFIQTLDLIEELRDYLYEVECNPFRYFNSGQSFSNAWDMQFKKYSVYPDEMNKHLLFKTYQLDTNPSREDIYNRVARFVNHCKKLNIPNPYYLQEVVEADKRWSDLQKNAVPNIMDFKNGYIDECKNLEIELELSI